ncbi:hypothetical protein L596_027329 [Steinernema carpocapsae]|uniref:Proteasome subunit beta type-4 n=1 Tax=Steinernema carpocapsae TaxID=34508 RepID=A0A4U5M406_STECR|nr:hypothetical protein L596_027329 [Steinernema carpocapsae]
MSGRMNFAGGVACDDFVLMAADKSEFRGAVCLTHDKKKGVKLGERLYMYCIGEPGDVSNFEGWAASNLELNKFRFGYELKPKAAHHFLQKAIADNLRPGSNQANVGFGSSGSVGFQSPFGGVNPFGGDSVGSGIGGVRNGGFQQFAPPQPHFAQQTNHGGTSSAGHAWKVDVVIGGYNEVDNKTFLGTIDQYGSGVSEQPYVFQGFSGRFCYSIMDKFYKKVMSEEEAVDVLKKCLEEVKTRFVASLPNFSVIKVDRNGVKHLSDIQF